LAVACFLGAVAPLPLYSSNQNTYLLHALAMAGAGDLKHDWLANTADPTPVFSWVSAGAYRLIGPAAFYMLWVALMAAYLLALLSIVRSLLPDLPWGASAAAVVAAGLILAHSYVPGQLLRVGGTPLYELLFGGLAGQYIPCQYYQPSLWGVLLIVSLAAYLRGQDLAGVLLAAVAATMHPTYLVTAGCLVAGYLIAAPRRVGWKRRLVLALLGAACVAPIAAYALWTFGPTSPELSAQARRILAEIRLPHHALPGRWLRSPAAWVQIAVMTAGLVWLLRRRSRMGLALLPAAVVGAAGTAVQIASGSLTMALLMPWRTTVVIMPVVSAMIIASLLDAQPPRRLRQAHGRATAVAAGAILLLCVASGLVAAGRFFADPKPTRWVRHPAGTGPDGEQCLIPPDMQGFRLAMGVPTYVDAKNHPYKDVEVVEWFRRLELARRFYEGAPDARQVRMMVDREGVTHCLRNEVPSPAFPYRLVRQDAWGYLYDLRQGVPATATGNPEDGQ
jgi:hypothetical protein